MPLLPAHGPSGDDSSLARAIFDEAERIDALRSCGILDTPQDESFDRLTRLASILTGVPMALISLVDSDRQWLKAQTNFGDGIVCQTPRDVSFCTHALGSADVMVVPDATRDRRFAGNPMVVDKPFIRFYAGAPLITRSGYRIGTFCILDSRPHAYLKEQERRIITDFAAITMDLIESRQTDRLRREAEADLKTKASFAQAQTRLFQNMLDTIDQGLSVLDSDFRLLMSNRAFQTVFDLPTEFCRPGVPFEAHIRHYLIKKAYDGDIESEIARMLKMLCEPSGSLLYIKTSAGRTIEIRTHALAQGGFVTTHSDITQMRTTEKELRRQEQMKDELISSISHELRTPLTSINGALGVLGNGGAGELPEKARRLIAIAEKNSERLIRLVNDLLDFERMVQGKYTLNSVSTDMGAVIEATVAAMEPYGERYDVRFDTTGAPTGTSSLVACDAERIGQVLLNLISNAAKFSPAGSVVRISCQDIPTGIRVEIADDGCGISEAFRDRIFEKFAQADRSDSRKHGTGLGLSIAKMIVEAHHGTIGFDSHEGVGSVFWFELPAAPLSS